MILCSKLKNGLCKIVIKSQVVTKFNVTKSRLHCTRSLPDFQNFPQPYNYVKFTSCATVPFKTCSSYKPSYF